uniref:MFS domain-containing protein n=1 Tax=Haemonchus placei TaxID=6290 RepID=A0A0N4VW58_HAEPC
LASCERNVVFDSSLEEKEVCLEPLHCSVQFDHNILKWNYFCGSAKTIKNSISMQMIGVLIGSAMFGQISDSFGRRKSMLVTMAGMAIGWILVAKSYDLTLFTVSRTAVGFFTGGSISVLNVFIMENIPKKHRMWINMAITWSPNMLPLAAMAWATGDWRSLALLNAIVCVPGLLFCFLCIHESPRWLIHCGKIAEAQEIMRREFGSSKEETVNDTLHKAVRNEYEMMLRADSQKRRYSFCHLFYTPKLAITTIVLAFS